MRCLAIFLSLLFAPAAALGQSQAPPHDLNGVWQTGARGGSWGYVRFAPCGPAFCGTLIGGGGANVQSQYFGTVLVTGMQWTGGEFAGGELLDVENGRVYLSRMRFRGPDELRVSGCVLGGLVCGGQTWRRVE
ncbi:DUF2147 domain-containing protein [Hasllibacter sp. MH4015]|uniref:DUF2147 domain-containing protein n=1 Tax=Hasllibacter sp. MH4015 TaxID=2854029 RepID=UPI001CD4D55E|nr:DUF2147 domain-containing protein [Hasllibacter sp. MH4015]